MVDASLHQALSALNSRLRAEGYRVSVCIAKGRLLVRGTFPPPPGSSKDRPYQQRRSLGLPATPAGLKQAEKRARQIGGDLLAGIAPARRDPVPRRDVGDWITAFEAHYWERRGMTPQTQTTWACDYAVPFSRLPQGAALSERVLVAALLSTAPDTRSRRRYAVSYQALAQFAGIECDLRPYRGRYGDRYAAPRKIPSDSEIYEWWGRIPSPEWRWSYGMIAAFGLSAHEVFQVQVDRWPRCFVLGGKHGQRAIAPLPKSWASDWSLSDFRVPHCTGLNNTALGQRVSHAFQRYQIPFPPGALRHAWAIRSIGKIDQALAARLMGHSLRVHCQIYQRWIDGDRIDTLLDSLPD